MISAFREIVAKLLQKFKAALNSNSYTRLFHKFSFCILMLPALPMAAYANNATLDIIDYEKAQVYLREDNKREAIKILSALVDRDSMNLGALLDLAIAQCQSNDEASAQAHFDRLSQISDIPPVIADLVSYYREKCRPPTPTWTKFTALSLGHVNNLNQAPSAEYFYLAPLNLNLKIADSARPINDEFRALDAGISRSDSSAGWNFGAFIQDTAYLTSKDYDTLQGYAKVGYRLKQGDFDLEGLALLSHLSIGRRSYLISNSVSGSAMHAVPNYENLDLGIAGTFIYLNYLTMPDYAARVGDVRGFLQWRPSPGLRLKVEYGLIEDNALRQRPGGDKTGQSLQLHGIWQLSPSQQLELLQGQTRLLDQTAYSPAFFGNAKRRPHLVTWSAAWRYQFREDMQIKLAARYGSNRDTLNFFDYQTSTLGITLEWSPK